MTRTAAPCEVLDGVSLTPETDEKLAEFVAMVSSWNQKINLVAKSTVPAIWTRHVRDSAQLMAYCDPGARIWTDIGSGGGFPAIVVAVIASQLMPQMRFVLIESDQRKAVFLVEAARKLNLPVQVHAQRAEDLAPIGADIVSARAVASLGDLLPLCHRHLAPDGKCLLLKGRQAMDEVAAARANWQFSANCIESSTDPSARVVIITDLSHV
jgi:16S rRNA (guanine527-N7)-methyltransferase